MPCHCGCHTPLKGPGEEPGCVGQEPSLARIRCLDQLLTPRRLSPHARAGTEVPGPPVLAGFSAGLSPGTRGHTWLFTGLPKIPRGHQ